MAGMEEAKVEIMEIVDFQESKKYTSFGGKIPKGVLLVGLPARVRPFLPKLWRVKQMCLSSQFQALTSLKCLLVGAHGFVISSAGKEKALYRIYR